MPEGPVTTAEILLFEGYFYVHAPVIDGEVVAAPRSAGQTLLESVAFAGHANQCRGIWFASGPQYLPKWLAGSNSLFNLQRRVHDFIVHMPCEFFFPLQLADLGPLPRHPNKAVTGTCPSQWGSAASHVKFP